MVADCIRGVQSVGLDYPNLECVPDDVSCSCSKAPRDLGGHSMCNTRSCGGHSGSAYSRWGKVCEDVLSRRSRNSTYLCRSPQLVARCQLRNVAFEMVDRRRNGDGG